MENTADVIIRQETEADHKAVETLIRNAFWNVNVPGCDEHYLAHIMRGHRDFIPELDLVAELSGRIIGSIMYTRSWLTDEKGCEKEIVTFGPVCIDPEFQRQGFGKRLICTSLERAAEMDYDAAVIFGHPGNYISIGFKSCKRYNITAADGSFPCAMLAVELREGSLSGHKWEYRESSVFDYDSAEAERFDSLFEPKVKAHTRSQEEFFIYSHCAFRENF